MYTCSLTEGLHVVVTPRFLRALHPRRERHVTKGLMWKFRLPVPSTREASLI